MENLYFSSFFIHVCEANFSLGLFDTLKPPFDNKS